MQMDSLSRHYECYDCPIVSIRAAALASRWPMLLWDLISLFISNKMSCLFVVFNTALLAETIDVIYLNLSVANMIAYC